MTEVVLIAYGKPAGKGSLRSVGKGRMVEDNPRTAPWRETVAQAALRQPVRGLDGPLRLDLVLTFRPPLRRGKASEHPITRATGDVDKHLRAVGDALVDAGVIVDDSRIIVSTVRKVYVDAHLDALEQPGAVIRLSTIEDEER